jgi:hypothetical protein
VSSCGSHARASRREDGAFSHDPCSSCERRSLASPVTGPVAGDRASFVAAPGHLGRTGGQLEFSLYRAPIEDFPKPASKASHPSKNPHVRVPGDGPGRRFGAPRCVGCHRPAGPWLARPCGLHRRENPFPDGNAPSIAAALNSVHHRQKRVSERWSDGTGLACFRWWEGDRPLGGLVDVCPGSSNAGRAWEAADGVRTLSP